MIRKATRADIPALVELGVESVSRNPLPVKIDPGRMLECAQANVGNPAHFCWVGETAGKVDAGFAAVVQPGFWFKGLQASVLLYYARAPGNGVALVRQFVRWRDSRPAIKLAVLEFEPEADPRLMRLFERLGFARRSMNLTYVR